MAQYLRTDPVGIDRVIDFIQKKIYANLVEKWGTLDIYDRVVKKVREQEISLERYVGNGEYEKVLFAEGNKVFFYQGDLPDISNGFANNDLFVIGILNLQSIYGNKGHIPDEEVHLDLVTELQQCSYVEEVSQARYGMDSLRNLVSDPFQVGNFKFSDIYPYHVFIIRTRVNYEITN